jgi:hypothetical protein
MNCKKKFPLFPILMVVPGIASALDTLSITDYQITPQSFANSGYSTSTVIGTSNHTFVMANSITINSGAFTMIDPGDFGTNQWFRLFNSGYPGLDTSAIRFFGGMITSGSGTITTPQAWSAMSGSLPGSEISPGSIWRINHYNDGLGNGLKAIITVNFTLRAEAPNMETLTLSGASYDLEGDPDNTVLHFPVLVPDYDFGPTIRTMAEGTATRIAHPTFRNDFCFVIRNSGHPNVRARIIPLGVNTSLITGVPVPITRTNNRLSLLRQSTLGSDPEGRSWNLLGARIKQGTTWTVEMAEVKDDGFDQPEMRVDNLVMKFSGADSPNATGAIPSPAEDLGVISNSTAGIATFERSYLPIQGTVQWFKFRVGEMTPFSGDYFDILSEAIQPETTVGAVNTEFALYSPNGSLLIRDYRDGQGDNAAITIGQTANPRPSSPIMGVLGPGGIMNGRDMVALGAGTYYLAVFGWGSSTSAYDGVDHGFLIPQEKRGTFSSPWKLIFRTNAPEPTCKISGRINLLDTVSPSNAEDLTVFVQSGTTVVERTVQISPTQEEFSVEIPEFGQVDNLTLKVKGGTYLAKSLNIPFTGAPIQGLQFSLRNGDIDQDGEVGPSDFEAVVTQFGGAGTADLDNDGEVGPSDFEIVVQNFGLTDE